jgi:hypothetical protein
MSMSCVDDLFLFLLPYTYILDIDWSVYSWRILFSMVFLFFFVDEDRCTLRTYLYLLIDEFIYITFLEWPGT